MVGARGLFVSLMEYPWPLFLQKGYAVFMPNTRGREGFGTSFLRAFESDHSQNRVPAQDAISGVEYLIKSGKVDAERIGIVGHSYGAGVAAAALTLTRRFRAASLHEGNGLFVDGVYAADWRNDQMKAYGLGSRFVPDERVLLEQDSPGEHADQIHTPVLLEFGEKDNAAVQGRQMFAALQYFHVPSEFVVFPRTGHVTTEPKLIADAYDRNLEWFNFWLMGIATDRMLKRYGPSPTSEWRAGPPNHPKS